MRDDILKCIEHKKYELLSSYMDNNVHNITKVLYYIENDYDLPTEDVLGVQIDTTKIRKEFLLSWLYAILSNPFDFKKILDSGSYERILAFCLENIEQYYIYKISIKCIVFLDKENVLAFRDSNTETYYIKNRRIREELYYCLLKVYSKYVKIDFRFTELTDSILILRYKLKIMSYQFRYYDDKKEVIEFFFKYLNSDNVKLGWTLSKCIVRIAKYVNIYDLVTSLKKECEDVFANESKWIHVITILSMLNLKNYKIGDVDRIITKTFDYDREFVLRSSTLREHSLFLIWSMVRISKFKCDEEFRNNTLNISHEVNSSYTVGEVFRIVFFRSLFDSSYSCRRAAVSIITEIVGNYRTEKGSKILELVNSNPFKRIEDGVKIYETMYNLFELDYTENLRKELFHYDIKIKELSSIIISRYYSHLDFYRSSTNICESLSLSYLLMGYIKNNNISLVKIPKFNFLFDEIMKMKFDQKLIRIRNTDKLVEIYLDILNVIYYERDDLEKYVDKNMLEIIENNLFFFLSKDFLSYKASRICWKINDQNFYKRLVNLRNLGGLLVNTKNKQIKTAIYKKIKDNIKQNDIELKIKTYKVLKYVEDIEYFTDEILIGLEEYTIDRRGDASFEIRYECLIIIKFNMEIFYRYLTRYLVDKNKYLRRHCISIVENIYKINLDFPCINTDSLIGVELPYNYNYVGFIVSFSRIYLSNLDILGYEKAYIKAMIKSSHLLDDELLYEFVIGIISFVSTCDRFINTFTFSLIIENLQYYDLFICRIIDKKYFRIYDYILKFIYISFENDIFGDHVYKYKNFLKKYNEMILKRLEYIENATSMKEKCDLINEKLK